MNNATPHAKMAARTHRKGFSPLPVDGWHEDRDGPWEAYVERCVREGAQVKNDLIGEYIEWLNDDGQAHREDGPAIERADGTKSWWANDQLHRLDGPAYIYEDGTVVFYKDGMRYTDITFTRRYYG